MKNYSVNGNSELTIKSENVFKKKNYMKNVKTVYIPKEETVSEFPRQEMVNSPTLKSVYMLGEVGEFRGDIMKELKLESLTGMIHPATNKKKHIYNISEPSVLKKLRIEALHPKAYVNGGGVDRLLEDISKAKNLESLTLDGLHITKFPDGFFRNFPKLTYLSLRGNRIRDPNVLNDISVLQKLEELDLSYNEHLTRLPDSITTLKKLGKLKLFGIRKLESLPKNIGKMEGLFNLGVSHNKKINIPESILKLSNNARVEYSSAGPNNNRNGSNNNRNGFMTTKYYYNHWKYIPNVSVKYINQKIPNNGASNSISYVNFKTGNTAMRIKNANRAATYMTANTFRKLANTAQGGSTHIYKRRSDVKNINDVYNLNGNTNIFINPMTTKMVKRSNIDFVKFV